MILAKLKEIVADGKRANLPKEAMIIQLKEFLIIFALNFIYNSSRWNKLVFTGGTALRILGKTGRLSEDLDLDYLEKEFNSRFFSQDLRGYFKKVGFPDVKISLRSQEKVIILKFPLLEKLGLRENNMKTDWLYLKIEIEKNRYPDYGLASTPVMWENLFFVVRSYDFPTLFANKIGAVLGRKGKTFLDQYDFRGRDFYDLIWFLEKEYRPNLKRTKEILRAEQKIEIKTYQDLWELLEKRIRGIDTTGIYEDLKNLVINPEAARSLSQNYLSIFRKLVEKIQ